MIVVLFFLFLGQQFQRLDVLELESGELVFGFNDVVGVDVVVVVF
jgi:hypothetical protein